MGYTYELALITDDGGQTTSLGHGGLAALHLPAPGYAVTG